MAEQDLAAVDGAELRAQLRNYLTMLEVSGVREIVLAEAGGGSWWLAAADKAAERPADGSAGGAAGQTHAAAGAPSAIAELALAVGNCRGCDLGRTRTNVVFGEGNPSARLMFVGEGPGGDEDAQGRPFVGRAGALLTKIIEAMGLSRGEVYIANVVKCRPPGNRVPDPDEIASCMPYLEQQIESIRPEVICTLGNTATQTLTGQLRPMAEMRGQTCDYKGIKVVPTYHPAACLRNPDSKKLVWEDIKRVMRLLDLPIRGVRKDGAGTNRN
ncbi:MAG: uracil-DNA glycosylase [bacterium]